MQRLAIGVVDSVFTGITWLAAIDDLIAVFSKHSVSAVGFWQSPADVRAHARAYAPTCPHVGHMCPTCEHIHGRLTKGLLSFSYRYPCIRTCGSVCAWAGVCRNERVHVLECARKLTGEWHKPTRAVLCASMWWMKASITRKMAHAAGCEVKRKVIFLLRKLGQFDNNYKFPICHIGVKEDQCVEALFVKVWMTIIKPLWYSIALCCCLRLDSMTLRSVNHHTHQPCLLLTQGSYWTAFSP